MCAFCITRSDKSLADHINKYIYIYIYIYIHISLGAQQRENPTLVSDNHGIDLILTFMQPLCVTLALAYPALSCTTRARVFSLVILEILIDSWNGELMQGAKGNH